MKIYSPAKGKAKTLKSLKDGVFSEAMLGDGVVIAPEDGMIYAPISGRLVTVFETKHAYGIEAKDGTSILVHIGLDTVNLEGKGFNSFVKQGKKIKAGKPLVEVDLAYVKKNAPSSDIVVVVLSESKTKIETKTTSGDVTPESIIIETA